MWFLWKCDIIFVFLPQIMRRFKVTNAAKLNGIQYVYTRKKGLDEFQMGC